MSKIDTTKPLELSDGTPVRLAYNGGRYCTVIVPDGHPFSKDGSGAPAGARQFNLDGTRAGYLAQSHFTIRNVPEAPKVDWTKPLEHVDGTPLVFKQDQQNPDECGDYFLVREDGKPLTEAQTGADFIGCMIVTSEGYGWEHHNTGSRLVRNRQETLVSTLDLSKPLQTADGKSVRLIASNIPGAMPLLVEVTYRSAFTKPSLELRAADGRVTNIPGRTSGDDVINVKPKPVLIYRNVYDDGTTGKSVHKTFNDARDRSKVGKIRIGILEVETTDGVVTNSKMFRCVPAVRTSALGNAAWNTAA